MNSVNMLPDYALSVIQLEVESAFSGCAVLLNVLI
jgi:hypothetical protein